jgi:hypothetical protein
MRERMREKGRERERERREREKERKEKERKREVGEERELLRKTEDIVDKEEGCQDLVRLCISRSRVDHGPRDSRRRSLRRRGFELIFWRCLTSPKNHFKVLEGLS